MPPIFPLELALLVVDFALPRLLVENRLDHRRRLTRIALVCKAFYKVVAPALKTVYITYNGYVTEELSRGLKRFEAEERPVEVFVRSGADENLNSLFWQYGRTIVALRYTNSSHLQWAPTAFLGVALPELRALSLNLSEHRTTPPDDSKTLLIRDLLLSSARQNLIEYYLNPKLAPHLQRLALHHVAMPWTTLRDLFSRVDLDKRLEFLQLGFESRAVGTHGTIPQNNLAVPTLLVVNSSQIFPASAGLADRFPFLQLQSITDLLTNQWSSVAFHWRNALDSLTLAIQQGAGRKAVFLPLDLRDSTSTGLGARVSANRDRLLATIEACGVEYIGWYHADEETDASTSEPFRRYLEKERLEGRM